MDHVFLFFDVTINIVSIAITGLVVIVVVRAVVEYAVIIAWFVIIVVVFEVTGFVVIMGVIIAFVESVINAWFVIFVGVTIYYIHCCATIGWEYFLCLWKLFRKSLLNTIFILYWRKPELIDRILIW